MIKRLVVSIGLFTLLTLGLFGCSDSVSKRGKGKLPSSNTSSTTCGDGALSPDESCDPGITAGETGACPTTCGAPDSCSVATLQGSAAGCDLECVIAPVACLDADGCCPSGCDATTDSDCTNICGNGELEAGEICDGDCPSSCSAPNACTTSTLSGSPDTCTAQCANVAVTACVDGDGCCPTDCEGLDSDCSCIPDDPCAGRQCGSATNSCGDQVSCGTCGNSETCGGNGICQPGQTASDIGTACQNDSDCAESVCLDDRETILTDGYCSASCAADSDCPSGSVCNGEGTCMLSCASDSDCPRAGYLCDAFSDVSTGICFVGGTGTGRVGDTCTTVSDCQGGTDGICFAGDPGGYCSEICTTDSDCPGSSHCMGGGYCMKDCTSSSSCRSGYGCGDIDFNGVDECAPLATGSGNVGDACTDASDCDGGIYGLCAQNQNFPGGYCLISCSPGGGTCDSGSFCSNAFQQPLCLESCSFDSDCRGGYTCEDLGDGETGCIAL